MATDNTEIEQRQQLIPVPHPRNTAELPDTGRHHVESPGKVWIGYMRPDLPLRSGPGLERLGDILARLHIEYPTFKMHAVRAAEVARHA